MAATVKSVGGWRRRGRGGEGKDGDVHEEDAGVSTKSHLQQFEGT